MGSEDRRTCGRRLTIRSTGHFAACGSWASFHSRPTATCRKMPVSSNVRRQRGQSSLFRDGFTPSHKHPTLQEDHNQTGAQQMRIDIFVVATGLLLATLQTLAAEKPASSSSSASASKKPTAEERAKLKNCTDQAKQMGRYIDNEPVPLSPADRKQIIAECMKR